MFVCVCVCVCMCVCVCERDSVISEYHYEHHKDALLLICVGKICVHHSDAQCKNPLLFLDICVCMSLFHRNTL